MAKKQLEKYVFVEDYNGWFLVRLLFNMWIEIRVSICELTVLTVKIIHQYES